MLKLSSERLYSLTRALSLARIELTSFGGRIVMKPIVDDEAVAQYRTTLLKTSDKQAQVDCLIEPCFSTPHPPLYTS